MTPTWFQNSFTSKLPQDQTADLRSGKFLGSLSPSPKALRLQSRRLRLGWLAALCLPRLSVSNAAPRVGDFRCGAVKSKFLAGTFALTSLLGLAATAPLAKAEFTITITQSAAGLTLTGAGSINTTDLMTAPYGGGSGAILFPSIPVVGVGNDAAALKYVGLTTALSPFGSGFPSATSQSGNDVAENGRSGGSLFVPVGYVSGTSLSGTAFFGGESFASLGLTIGTYTSTWGTGANADSFIVNIAVNNTGPLLQNSAPVNIPTTADFIVNGPVQTGGPMDNNTVHTLTFLPGSSLHIYNNLFVTLGPVILPGGASITLDGSLTVNQLQLLFGSLLNGNGSIVGDLINAGVLSPGHSPGLIHVAGNYTQTAQGTLQIEIAGRHNGEFDVLAVDGKASLNGTLAIVKLNNFQVRRGDTFKFLTAGQGVSGQFANVVDGFATDTILNPVVVYHQNDVSLEVPTFESFANTWNLTPNQKSVARALDSTNYDNRASNLINYLESRNISKLPGDFDKIAPEELTSVFTLGVSLANVQSQNIQRRTDDIRSGANGFNAGNLALNGNGPSYSGAVAFRTGAAGPNGSGLRDDGKEVKETKEVVPAENRWGAFLSGTGEWVSVGDTDNARGYNLESGGFTLGVDYKITPNLAIGLAGGYTGTTADLTQGGRIYVNGGKIGLYGTFFQNEQPAPTMSKDSSKDSSKEAPAPAPSIAKGFYADVAVFGGYNSYDTRRSALQGTARGDTDGGELNVLFGTGYDFKTGGLTFGPTATFNYTYLGTNAFTENGSLAPLNIHGGQNTSLRSAFGFKASYDIKAGSVLIKPELRAAWQHEYGDTAASLNSDFANGAGNSFLVTGPEIGRDSALLGAGFAIEFNDHCAIYTYYDGELGRKNYQSTNVTGGMRIAF